MEKQARRNELLKSLAAQQLTPEQQQLMYKSTTVGQKETARQQLRRALRHERAGIALPEMANNVTLVQSVIADNNPSVPSEKFSGMSTVASEAQPQSSKRKRQALKKKKIQHVNAPEVTYVVAQSSSSSDDEPADGEDKAVDFKNTLVVPTDAPKGGGTSPGDLSDSESEDKKTGMLKALEKLRAKNAAKAIAKTVKPEAATEAALHEKSEDTAEDKGVVLKPPNPSVVTATAVVASETVARSTPAAVSTLGVAGSGSAYYVLPRRPAWAVKARSELPACGMETEIMEGVSEGGGGLAYSFLLCPPSITLPSFPNAPFPPLR